MSARPSALRCRTLSVEIRARTWRSSLFRCWPISSVVVSIPRGALVWLETVWSVAFMGDTYALISSPFCRLSTATVNGMTRRNRRLRPLPPRGSLLIVLPIGVLCAWCRWSGGEECWFDAALRAAQCVCLARILCRAETQILFQLVVLQSGTYVGYTVPHRYRVPEQPSRTRTRASSALGRDQSRHGSFNILD